MPIQIWRKKLCQLALIVPISGGILSCAVYSQADTWWSKQKESYHLNIAKIVNQTDHSLVMATWFDIATLSHSLALP